MNETEVIRALETLNARAIALRSSKEYAAGVRKGNVSRLLSDVSPQGIRRAFKEFQTYRAFSKVARHEELPNLDPEEWEASLVPGDPNKQVVIYTCVAGGYDALLPPLYKAQHIRYVLFTDDENLSNADGWETRPFPEEVKKLGKNAMASRYLKSHPHELFAGHFDASIYVDGNVQPVSDLSYYLNLVNPACGISMHLHRVRDSIADEAEACKALGKGDPSAIDSEIAQYVAEGFPLDYGLLETNIVATDLYSDVAHSIMSEWWNTMSTSKSGRDQLSLPYVLWKMHISIKDMGTMGRNPYRDTKIFINNHI